MSRPFLCFLAASAAVLHVPAQTVRFGRATDTIRLTNNTVLGSAATIEAVVWLDGPASAGFIFQEWTDNAEDKLLRIGPSNLEGYGILSRGSVLYTAPVATNRWHHVAYVYDGMEQRLYLDGQQVGTRSTPSGSFNNATGLGHLGDSPHPAGVSFQGFLESFRISAVARYIGSSFAPPTRDMTTDAATLVLYNFNEPAGSPTVSDSSGNGNHGTLGVGIAGATSPSLGIRVMTCQRTAGGLLNQQPVDDANGTISVAPGGPIAGSVRLLTYNDMQAGAVAPLAGTVNWGTRTAQYWTVNGWIATGTNTYTANVNLVAPTAAGTHYLIFGFGGKYGADQVMSGTHPAISAIWFDGNDVGFDWTAQQFATAVANGGAVWLSERLPGGGFDLGLLPFTAVRVNVSCTPATVTELGAGCPGSRGTPVLTSGLPRLGTTVTVLCQNLVPWQPAAIFWGSSSTHWNNVPLPFNLGLIGMNNCLLRVSLEAVTSGLNFAGVFPAGVHIPSNPSLIGSRVYVQGFGADPGVNPFGAVLSNALTLTIGC